MVEEIENPSSQLLAFKLYKYWGLLILKLKLR